MRFDDDPFGYFDELIKLWNSNFGVCVCCYRRVDMDRIGPLPDELLCLILSFLATKDAAQSSVLSRRWRSLYRTVTCLDLSDGMHSSKKNFREFVCRVLMPRYMDRIEKVRLHCDCGTEFDATYVTEWIAGCVCYGVQVLELLFSECKANMLPHCLFNSQTLVVLKLQFSADFCQLLRIPPSVSLPNLKELHLTGVRLPDNDSFSRLISGCPLLEDLRFVDCRFWEDEEAYYISSPSLRKFTVEKWVPSRCMSPDILNDILNDDSEVPTMTLDAKSLVYFKHHGNIIEEYWFENANAFVEVDLHDEVCTWGCPLGLLNGVSSVQVLRLGGRMLESLVGLICSGNSGLKLPMFPRLSRLHLSFSVCGGWEVLPTLLISSPKLKTLVISELLDYCCRHQNWHPKLALPSFTSDLKVIEVGSFTGEARELELVDYFFENAKALKQFILHLEDADQHRLVHEKLLLLKSRPTSCSIVLRKA